MAFPRSHNQSLAEPRIQSQVSLSSERRAPTDSWAAPLFPHSQAPSLTVTAQPLFAKTNARLAQVAVDWSGEPLGSPHVLPIVLQGLGGHSRCWGMSKPLECQPLASTTQGNCFTHPHKSLLLTISRPSSTSSGTVVAPARSHSARETEPLPS